MTFWSKLKSNIHPLDASLLRNGRHSLNLEYPPPAFVGDVANANIFVLMANGGFHPVRTATEFAKPDAGAIYRNRLRRPGPCDDENTSPYYLRGPLGAWLRSGEAAIVNALAYRSPKISQEPENITIAARLPSVLFHKEWLEASLLPAAKRRRVTIVVKRPGLWGIREPQSDHDYILFPKNHVSYHLPKAMVELISQRKR